MKTIPNNIPRNMTLAQSSNGMIGALQDFSRATDAVIILVDRNTGEFYIEGWNREGGEPVSARAMLEQGLKSVQVMVEGTVDGEAPTPAEVN